MIGLLKVVDKILEWENAGKSKLLSVGYSLREPQLLFRKIEDSEIRFQVEKLRSGLVKPVDNSSSNEKPSSKMEDNTAAAKQPEKKSAITFEDFSKLDLRVGTIVAAEKIDKADKLLKLEVDLGYEKRTIVSGIALQFRPEEIVNRQVVVVVNLVSRKMKGIESQGMILMAEDKSGKLHFVAPENKISAGAVVN
jgi:methionyl-tRNA synthetase